MKQILKSINPKQIFQRKPSSKSSNLSKSPPSSFVSSSNTSTISDDTTTATITPNSLYTKPFVTTTTTTTDKKDENIFKFDVNSAFKMIDRDNNGKIDRNELKAVLNNTITEDELELMIKEVDTDGDGFITLEELQAVGPMFETTAKEEEDELRAAFGFFDEDEDGKIDANELFKGLVKLGDHKCTLDDCRRMIEEVDVNHDGFVCFQDFSRMMINVFPTSN